MKNEEFKTKNVQADELRFRAFEWNGDKFFSHVLAFVYGSQGKANWHKYRGEIAIAVNFILL